VSSETSDECLGGETAAKNIHYEKIEAAFFDGLVFPALNHTEFSSIIARTDIGPEWPTPGTGP